MSDKRVGNFICGPKRSVVDRVLIFTERILEAATQKTEKTLFLLTLRFLKETTPFVVFRGWCVLLCPRTRYASISLASYLD